MMPAMSPAIFSFFQRHAIVPAIVLDDETKAAPLAEALFAGGLPCAEVTLRSPNALKVLATMAQHPGVLVGAGTVINTKQAAEAIAAGAKFIVSPGIDASLVRFCQEKEVPIIPGAVTGSEMMQAVNLGLTCVKFFPCESSGGLPALKALHGPFPELHFMPTGGINGETFQRYLSFAPVLAIGGTWTVRPEWLRSESYDLIEDACRLTMIQVLRLRHPVPMTSAVAAA